MKGDKVVKKRKKHKDIKPKLDEGIIMMCLNYPNCFFLLISYLLFFALSFPIRVYPRHP
jgi:hypothetical protein